MMHQGCKTQKEKTNEKRNDQNADKQNNSSWKRERELKIMLKVYENGSSLSVLDQVRKTPTCQIFNLHTSLNCRNIWLNKRCW